MIADVREATDIVLRRDHDNGVCDITINRPKVYNALSIECMEALQHAIDELSHASSVKAVVISGSGNKFCAGHDLKELRQNRNRQFYQRTFAACSKLMQSIVFSPKPFIAKVQGIATAAGCQLVATCDLAVAAEDARFATPGVNIGLFCSTPMVAVTRCVGRKHAMEMLLLGDFISARRAYEIGLVNRVAAKAKLDEVTHELAAAIASKSAETLKVGKRAFQEQLDRGLKSAYDYCNQVMVENMMHDDAEEGIEAFLAKRAPQWTDND